jgi:hypothetical protein
MNGNSALLDSNILIYLSKNELPFSILDQFAALFVSIISYMEVLGYRFSNSKEENFVKELVSIFNVRFIDQEIAENVIDIRKQYRIKLPDAIIAATANTDDLCLVTRNIEDFKNINIKILDPFD